MSQFVIVAMTVATGFVVAGVLASFHQWVTDRPASFKVDGGPLAGKLWSAMLIAFSGPVILIRNGVRGHQIEHRPAYWLMLTVMIAAGWSFCSGVFVLQLALAI